MQTRSKTAAKRNRLTSKSLSQLAEPPLRIGCFNLQKFGKIRHEWNKDFTHILVEVLKRYDLLLIMEQRTTAETNIDRLIKRLNTIDESSPFDYELSEAVCRMHGWKEQYCFFYRSHKLSVLHVHWYGEDALSGKGWRRGQPRQQPSTASPDDGLHATGSGTSIISYSERSKKESSTRSESTVSFFLPHGITAETNAGPAHQSMDSLLGPDGLIKRDAFQKASDSVSLGSLSLDDFFGSSCSSPQNRKPGAVADGYEVGVRKSKSSINLVEDAEIQENTQEVERDDEVRPVGLRQSTSSMNIPEDALRQCMVGEEIRSVYEEDHEEEEGGKQSANAKACDIGLRQSRSSVNIPLDAYLQSDEFLEDSDEDKDKAASPDEEENKEEEEEGEEAASKGRDLGLRKSRSHVNLPHEASLQKDDDEEEEEEEEEQETEVPKGRDLGLRKSRSHVNLPHEAFRQSVLQLNDDDSFSLDNDEAMDRSDDKGQDDDHGVGSSCEIGLKKSVSRVNLPLTAILQDSDEEVEQAARSQEFPRRASSDSSLTKMLPGASERRQVAELTNRVEQVDSSDSLPGCDVGLRKSMSCLNLIKTYGWTPYAGILRGYPHDRRKFSDPGRPSTFTEDLRVKLFHHKKVEHRRTVEPDQGFDRETSVHFADVPDVRELSSDSTYQSPPSGAQRPVPPAGRKESGEWPEHQIGLRKSASNVDLVSVAQRQSVDLEKKLRTATSIEEESDDHQDVEVGLRKSMSSVNLAITSTPKTPPPAAEEETVIIFQDYDEEEQEETGPRSSMSTIDLLAALESGLTSLRASDLTGVVEEVSSSASPMESDDQHVKVDLHKSMSQLDLTANEVLYSSTFGYMPILEESWTSLDSKAKLDKMPDPYTEASARLDALSKKGEHCINIQPTARQN